MLIEGIALLVCLLALPILRFGMRASELRCPCRLKLWGAVRKVTRLHTGTSSPRRTTWHSGKDTRFLSSQLAAYETKSEIHYIQRKEFIDFYQCRYCRESWSCCSSDYVQSDDPSSLEPPMESRVRTLRRQKPQSGEWTK